MWNTTGYLYDERCAIGNVMQRMAFGLPWSKISRKQAREILELMLVLGERAGNIQLRIEGYAYEAVERNSFNSPDGWCLDDTVMWQRVRQVYTFAMVKGVLFWRLHGQKAADDVNVTPLHDEGVEGLLTMIETDFSDIVEYKTTLFRTKQSDATALDTTQKLLELLGGITQEQIREYVVRPWPNVAKMLRAIAQDEWKNPRPHGRPTRKTAWLRRWKRDTERLMKKALEAEQINELSESEKQGIPF